jgi:hypothetical protein
MNKFFLFLAVFFLAFFTACSDDKGPCDDGPSAGCIAGEWNLEKVIRADGIDASTRRGILKLTIENGVGFYDFTGGEYGENFIVSGTWVVDGTTLTATTDDKESLPGTITLIGDVMSIKSTTGKAVFSLFKDDYVPTPTEKFTRR